MITIVTDSSSYFKKTEAEALGVKVIPLGYTVNGRAFFESFSDQNGDLENLLISNSEFTTSQPNLAAFLSCFEEELSKGNEVLCITISSRLSGTYSTAHSAAKQTESSCVAVFDSLLTAGGLYLLIKRAAALIKRGMSLDNIIEKMPNIRDTISMAFSVDDITPLRKSGRSGFVRMGVETILNRKPVLLLSEGAVAAQSVARGNADMFKKLIHVVSPDAKEIVISYIGNSRLVTNLFGTLGDAYPQAELYLHKIGPVLGIHLGVNAVAVSFTNTID